MCPLHLTLDSCCTPDLLSGAPVRIFSSRLLLRGFDEHNLVAGLADRRHLLVIKDVECAHGKLGGLDLLCDSFRLAVG